MARQFIKRWLPDHGTIRNHHALQLFGTMLHEPNLWHLNRRSAAGAFAVGLFVAFVPIPFQMVLAAAIAIVARVNLPLSVALVFTTNPLTMPPLYFFCYKLGAWLLSEPPRHFHFQLSMHWLLSEMGGIWKPFLLGSFLVGTFSAVLGYSLVRLLWRLSVVDQLQRKRRMHAARREARRLENLKR